MLICGFLVHFHREKHRLQQEERKAARAKPKPVEKEAPKEDQKVLKKRPETKKPEPTPQEPKEPPKLKKVEQVKASSPVRRSQSPELRDKLRKVGSPVRAESPARRAESPIPKLKPTPKKAPEKEAAPEKVRTQR